MVDIDERGVGKERESLRGLTTRSIQIKSASLRARIQCVVVGDKFPCWLPHYGSLGSEVVIIRVHLQSDEFLKIIARQVSETCVIQVG